MKPGAELVLDGWDSVAYAPLVFRRTDAKRAGRGSFAAVWNGGREGRGQRQGQRQIRGSFASLQDDGVKRATATARARARARARATATARAKAKAKANTGIPPFALG